VPVNPYINTLYEGSCTTKPLRNTIYLFFYMVRQVSYAAIIIFLYYDPVF
jgi:hypothetical protein